MFTGEILLKTADVSSGGYGQPWSHTRVYTNAFTEGWTRYNGWNWNVENWPLLRYSPFPDSTLMLLGDLHNILWFRQEGDGSYTTLFGNLNKLTYDPATDVFSMLAPDGTVTEFEGVNHPTRSGLFKSVTIPGGGKTEVTGYSASDILNIERQYTSGEDTITEIYSYDSIESGEKIGSLERVTLSRKVNGGDPTNVLKAEYTYYGSTSEHGSLNDLETVTRYEWKGGDWSALDVNYYRYYVEGEEEGFLHGLKFVVGPEAWVKLATVADPLTADDSLVAQYADNYFEYDDQQRVTREITDGGSRMYTLQYIDNGEQPDPSGPRQFNWWSRKTVQTRPDESVRIVYSNNYGGGMLDILKDGGSEWYSFYQYDDFGRVVMTADSASITGYDDTYNDLLNYDTEARRFEYLADNAGMLQRTEFYTTTGDGAADGYIAKQTIQNGQLGASIPLKAWTYTVHTAGENTIFPILKETLFPDESDHDRTIETAYAYTFHPSSNQIYERITTLPTVSIEQNGSGVPNTFSDVFDLDGYRTWHKDERGYITRHVYHIPTGTMTQRVEDVDTSAADNVPNGWTTPPDGGLNLVTDYEHDHLGRVTQMLGPVYEVSSGGVARNIRRAIWTIYKDAYRQQLSAAGYHDEATGTDTLINPVSIAVTDRNGNTTDQIQATRSTSGKLQPADEFPQASWIRWTANEFTECCLISATRIYHEIPSSGTGTNYVHYNKTEYGYDVMKRRNRTKSPGGTITRTVFDARGLPIDIFVGTNDDGATETDPSGSGTLDNNMVVVVTNQYDEGEAGGNGNLTLRTQHITNLSSRTVGFEYDWRNRQVATYAGNDTQLTITYDNLDRQKRSETHSQSTPPVLLDRTELFADDLNRLYKSVEWGVSPNSGDVTTSLSNNFWYDASGNVIMHIPSKQHLFIKTKFDSLGRPVLTSTGANESAPSYSAASSIANDVLLTQAIASHDVNGNLISLTVLQRNHNASGVGPLNGPTGAEPRSRNSYACMWYDPVGREVSAAHYGTNGGVAVIRPPEPPTGDDQTLVSRTTYDSAGMIAATVDPSDTETRYAYDAAGRRTDVIEAYTESNGPVAETICDDPGTAANRVKSVSYNPDGLVASLTIVDAESSSAQTTLYDYGTTLEESSIASSRLLRTVTFPGPGDTSDFLTYSYDRQGQLTRRTGQTSTHEFSYDSLGRLVEDRVTDQAADVDTTVLCVTRSYTLRNELDRVTSWSTRTPTGVPLNQIAYLYNAYSQATDVYQEHNGNVVYAQSPRVHYSYADGANNTTRIQGVSYPSGYAFSYLYGAVGSLDDLSGRISEIQQNGTTVASYEYLGVSRHVSATFPEPSLRWTLMGDGSGTGNDLYAGLDRFSRIADLRWHSDYAGVDFVHLGYGYTRAGTRGWRKDLVASSLGREFDESYQNDPLLRLTSMRRGAVDSDGSLTSLKFAECWGLDFAGNWLSVQVDTTGDGTWDRSQARAVNVKNQISTIETIKGPGLAPPTYDSAGSMVVAPGFLGWADVTVDIWWAASEQDWAGLDIAGEGAVSITYDAWGRAVRYTNRCGRGATCGYDGLDRVVVFTPHSHDGTEEVSHRYYSENWQLLEETDAEGEPTSRRLWGLQYVDDCVFAERVTNEPETQWHRHYNLADANWNVVAVASASGELLSRVSYSSYGAPTTLDAEYNVLPPPKDLIHLWAGYLYDPRVGLYFVRNRIFSPVTGCWLQRDPLGYIGEMNLYALTLPNDSTDPFGLQDEVFTQTLDEYFKEWDLRRGISLKPETVGRFGGTRNIGCAGIVLCQLGYPAKGAFDHPDGVDVKALPNFQGRCFVGLGLIPNDNAAKDQAEKLVKEMNDLHFCCQEGQRNIRGGHPEAKLVVIAWENGVRRFRVGQDGRPVQYVEPEFTYSSDPKTGRITTPLTKQWWKGVLSTNPATGLNFDFFVKDTNMQGQPRYYHANHGQQFATKDDPVEVYQRTEEQFMDKIRSYRRRARFNEIWWCAVCQRQWEDAKGGYPVQGGDS